MHEDPFGTYMPQMSDERIGRLRAWHEAAYQGDARDRDRVMAYLGRTFVIPPQVHPIQGMAEFFSRALLDEVTSTDRVLDMGTGCGVNAVLAASKSTDVVAVDVNPVAVATAEQNAERNGVGDHVEVRESDAFENVDGTFDLIIFDPPFRWFKPRDLRERGTADENYASLRAFFREVRSRLNPGGRVLLGFGTSGDIDFLKKLIEATDFKTEVLVQKNLVKDDQTVSYFTYRLT